MVVGQQTRQSVNDGQGPDVVFVHFLENCLFIKCFVYKELLTLSANIFMQFFSVSLSSSCKDGVSSWFCIMVRRLVLLSSSSLFYGVDNLLKGYCSMLKNTYGNQKRSHRRTHNSYFRSPQGSPENCRSIRHFRAFFRKLLLPLSFTLFVLQPALNDDNQIFLSINSQNKTEFLDLIPLFTNLFWYSLFNFTVIFKWKMH